MKPRNPSIKDARSAIKTAMGVFATRVEGYEYQAGKTKGKAKKECLDRADEMRFAKEMMQGLLLALEENPGR